MVTSSTNQTFIYGDDNRLRASQSDRGFTAYKSDNLWGKVQKIFGLAETVKVGDNTYNVNISSFEKWKQNSKINVIKNVDFAQNVIDSLSEMKKKDEMKFLKKSMELLQGYEKTKGLCRESGTQDTKQKLRKTSLELKEEITNNHILALGDIFKEAFKSAELFKFDPKNRIKIVAQNNTELSKINEQISDNLVGVLVGEKNKKLAIEVFTFLGKVAVENQDDSTKEQRVDTEALVKMLLPFNLFGTHDGDSVELFTKLINHYRQRQD